MDWPYDIAVGLAAAAVGSGLTTAWHASVLRVKYRRRRQFWSFLEYQTVFVVGEMDSEVLLNTLFDNLADLIPLETERQNLVAQIVDHIRTQENSGLIGRGDFDTVAGVLLKLAELKIAMRPIVRHPEDLGDLCRENLILIGGPDVNELTKEVLPRIGCQFSVRMNSKGKNAVFDDRLNSEHAAGVTPSDVTGETIEVDYGFFARARNPFNPNNEVIVMAGAHGRGTLAASAVSLRDENQDQLWRALKSSPYRSIECLMFYRNRKNGPANNGEYELEICRHIPRFVH